MRRCNGYLGQFLRIRREHEETEELCFLPLVSVSSLARLASERMRLLRSSLGSNTPSAPAANKTSSSKGFARKPKAPAAKAVWRADGSSRPLMTMTRVSGEFSRREACTSKPLMAGIQTSRTATLHRSCSSLERKSGRTVKLLYLKAGRRQQTAQRPQHGSIVVKEPDGIAGRDPRS